MFKKGLLKRFVPFFLTLAIGLLVASFFVSLSLPNFNPVFTQRYEVRHSCWRSADLMRENQRLREEKFRLNQEFEINQQFQRGDTVTGTIDRDENGKFTKFRMRKAENSLDDLVPPPPMLTPLHK